MSKNQRSIDFKINVEFLSKVNKDLSKYISTLNNFKENLGENSLGRTFLSGSIKELKEYSKVLNSANKIATDPKLTPRQKISGLDNIIKQAQDLSKIMDEINTNWLKNVSEGDNKFSKELDLLYEKQERLVNIGRNKTRYKNQQNTLTGLIGEMGAGDIVGGSYSKAQIKKMKALYNRNAKDISKNRYALENSKLSEEEAKNIKDEIDLYEERNDKIAQAIKYVEQYIDLQNKLDKVNDALKIESGGTDVVKAKEKNEKDIKSLQGKIATPYERSNMENILNTGKSDITNQLPTLNDQLKEEADKATEAAEATEELRSVLAEFGLRQIGVREITRYLIELTKQAFEFYRNLDQALNEIYVVSDLSINKVNSLKTNFIGMAKSTGMSIDDITKSAVLFYQQGLNTSEVITMTNVTSEFAKVAGTSATDAADKLTAAVNGYRLAAKDAALVADKFNQVAAASAADINELSTAFSKAAAQANQAGVGMDAYLAYIATMEEATREARTYISYCLA